MRVRQRMNCVTVDGEMLTSTLCPMSSKALVASQPAHSNTTSSPPGWLGRKAVMSYTWGGGTECWWVGHGAHCGPGLGGREGGRQAGRKTRWAGGRGGGRGKHLLGR
jgi:hypothetical protein